MRILALDLGSKTGWSLGELGSQAHEYGTENFTPKPSKKNPPTEAQRFARFFDWLTSVFEAHQIQEIHYEKVNPATFKSARATECWIGFHTVLLVVSDQYGIPAIPWGVGTIKKTIANHGRADKDQMIQAVQKLGYNPQDDNQADALAVFECVRRSAGTQNSPSELI